METAAQERLSGHSADSYCHRHRRFPGGDCHRSAHVHRSLCDQLFQGGGDQV